MIVAEEVTMDRIVREFRGAGKGRPGRGYPLELRRRAADYARERAKAGDGVAAVSAELGVSEQTLRNWLRKTGPGFLRVMVEEPERCEEKSVAGRLVLVAPSGYRLEGLDLGSAADLLRVLR
jgi:transposase-like protein